MKQVTAFVLAAMLAAPTAAIAAGRPAPLALGEQLPAARPTQAAAFTLAAVRLDRRVLYAYSAYLSAVVTGASTAQAAETAYVASVSSQCRGALAPLTLPAETLDSAARHTLTVVGQEIGDDLSLGFDQAFLPAFTRFALQLRRLQWGRPTMARLIVNRYVAAERRVLVMAPSTLCQDAELAATDPQLVPPATASFLKLYGRAVATANLRVADLLRLIGSYQTAGEKSLITHIGTLAGQVATVTKASLTAAGSQLTGALEKS